MATASASAPTTPVQATAPGIAETVSLDALAFAPKSSAKSRERQTQFDAALQSLVPGGDAHVFHLTDADRKDGKPNPRGLKLRIAYAVKRLKLQNVSVQDAKITATGEPVVAAFIPKK